MPKTLESLAAGKAIPGDGDVDSAWEQKCAPPWFDQAKFDRGIAFFRAHMSSVLFSYLLSLIAGFNLDVFLQTLLFTGQSTSPEVSGKRYFATLLYILQWYDSNVTDGESIGHKSLMRVRRIHHHVRLALQKRQKKILLDIVDHRRKDSDCGYLVDAEEASSPRTNPGFVEKDDEDDFAYIDLQQSEATAGTVDDVDPSSVLSLASDYDVVSLSDKFEEEEKEEEKLYLNQYDMALVQVAFVAGVVLYPDWIGINASAHELEDYIYTWRVFGWYLGIHDRFNVCEGSFEDVRSITAEIKDFELVPAIKRKSPDADIIARAFIKGSHAKFQRQDASVSSFLSAAALISISQRPFQLGKEYEPPDLTYFDEFCIFFLHLFFLITYYVPPFRRLVNSVLSLPNVIKLIA